MCNFKVKRTRALLKNTLAISMLTIQSNGEGITLNCPQSVTDPSSYTWIIRLEREGNTLNCLQSATDPSSCTWIVRSSERGVVSEETQKQRIRLLLFDGINRSVHFF